MKVAVFSIAITKMAEAFVESYLKKSKDQNIYDWRQEFFQWIDGDLSEFCPTCHGTGLMTIKGKDVDCPDCLEEGAELWTKDEDEEASFPDDKLWDDGEDLYSSKW